MANQTITAMFPTRAEADRAAEALRTDLKLAPGAVSVLSDEASGSTGVTTTDAGVQSGSYEDRGFWSSLKNLFVPDEDRYAYAEGLSRGNFLVSASVDATIATHAMDILEQHGAVDLDAQERTWKESGWQSHAGGTYAADGGIVPPAPIPPAETKPMMSTASNDMAMAGRVPADGTAMTDITTTPQAAMTTSTGVSHAGDQVIPLVEETLTVGKRDVSHGRVRVRSYVVETPVSEQVTLRDEHVSIERRPVDRAVTAADADVFRERSIEATQTDEEAVVAKNVRVREEVVLHKDVEERTETITDKVRHTEVEIDGDHASTGTTKPSADPLRKPI